uniref:BRCA1-associated protein n=1 Tax=Oryza brachyantha TaxID=4533 RepID=J3LA94_ORYBR
MAGESISLAPSASTSSPATALDSVPFSSGNPRIEAGRKPWVCMPAVPNHLTYADFCSFCGTFLPHMLEMRIVRIDGVEDQYSVLIKFDTQSDTDGFYDNFNGRHFTSLEDDVCRIRFVEEVHYTQLIEHTHSSVTSSAEQPTCPVCLERLDQDPGGILTTICNHSFHCSCISKWTDSSCPVCRYCQQQPEKSMCSICGTSENLWICVICDHVGCGRYKGGHAIAHWKETQHCYSLELETQKVWGYARDSYVHRLIQLKTDGNLFEYNLYGDHSADGMCSTCSGDAGINEALLNSKVVDIVEEYNDLVTSQLEKQRNYYESLLLEVKEDNEKEITAATEKAVGIKVQKSQAKLDKCMEETRFLNDVSS